MAFLFPFDSIIRRFFISFLLTHIKIRKSIRYILLFIFIICYAISVTPAILDYGPDDRQVVRFAKHVAQEYKKSKKRIAIAVALTTYHYKGKALGCNRYTVRYYLKRAGIPGTGFKWRAHPESDIFWLVCVQPDGSPIKTFQKLKWDFCLGPYGLKKAVSKKFIQRWPTEAL